MANTESRNELHYQMEKYWGIYCQIGEGKWNYIAVTCVKDFDNLMLLKLHELDILHIPNG